MNVGELRERLAKYPDDMDVAILDGFNGGGSFREINLGPTSAVYKEGDDPEDWEDIEYAEVGTKIVYMGYGCY
jgi:hypothetical protein